MIKATWCLFGVAGLLAATGCVQGDANDDDELGGFDQPGDRLADIEQAAAGPCTISITASPGTVTYGDPIALSAIATCSSGSPIVQWYRNNAIIQPFSPATELTFNSANGVVGNNTFVATVRRAGVNETPAASNSAVVRINDNVPQCSSVRMTAPANGSTGAVNQPLTLQASAVCPIGATAEYSFFVKRSTDANWTQLAQPYTLTTMQFTPPSVATWQIQGVARAVGAHVNYQVRSSAIAVAVSEPANRAPVALADSPTIPHGLESEIDVLANDSDADGDSLTITAVTDGSHGSLTNNGSNVSYAPAGGFAGTDSFTYTISDGRGGSATATVSVVVANQAPIALDDTASGNQGSPVSIPVLANDSDADGDTLSISGVSNGSNGSAAIEGLTITYTPQLGFTGTDTITYQIADGFGGSDSASVTITMSTRSPVAADDTAVTSANAPVSIPVLANDSDPDGDSLTVTAATSGSNGTTSTNGTVVTYSPALNFSGTDQFSYTISDGRGGSSTATVTVTVNAGGPGCSISITAQQAQVTWGDAIQLTAVASCNTGPAQIEWSHAFPGSGLRVIRTFGSAAQITVLANDPLLQIGSNRFSARARTLGTASPVATSNIVSVNVVDTVASCTSVKMTGPAHNSVFPSGAALSLTASAVCPTGVFPEFLFFVKRSTDANWTELPGYVTDARLFTPPSAATWQINATVRSVGSHTRYQARSASVSVIVQPAN